MELGNHTQLEIEQFFDKEQSRTHMLTEYQIFFDNVRDKDVLLMSQLLKTEDEGDITDVFIYLLSILGNIDVGVKVGLDKDNKEVNHLSSACVAYSGERDINVNNLIQGLAKSPTIQSIYSDKTTRFDVALRIVAEFDTILYDLHKKVRHTEDDFITITYARCSISFAEDVNLIPRFARFRFPMIETPDDWTQDSNGGYKLNKRKITTNKGEADQPQAVKDVLNKLQRQSYILRDNIDAQDEFDIVHDSLESKGRDEFTQTELAKNICLTTKQTYEALMNKEFYFEWRYDFRGRLYSTGYDINLQSTKFKKSSLLHTFN